MIKILITSALFFIQDYASRIIFQTYARRFTDMFESSTSVFASKVHLIMLSRV